MKTSLVSRIAKNGILLAVLCVIGMFSIPLGANIKVSLQLLGVMIICFLVEGVVDALVITGCYLGIGMLLPVYAGFSAGISPTWGFVLGFVLAAPVYYFVSRIPKLPRALTMAIAGVVGTLVVYAAGTIFMMLYLNWGLGETLLVAVVPYLPFDAGKIALAILLIYALPKLISSQGCMGKK